MKCNQALLIPLALVLLAGCSKQTSTSSPAEPSTAGSALDKVVGQEVAQTEDMSIVSVKPNAKEGDTITVEGKVMGTLHPFVDHRAVVMIGDESTITSCDLMDDDHCQTPWDACCDAPELRTAGMITVQVVDANGKVVAQGLKGVAGLKELSRVRVRGTVATIGGGALVLNASAIQLL